MVETSMESLGVFSFAPRGSEEGPTPCGLRRPHSRPDRGRPRWCLYEVLLASDGRPERPGAGRLVDHEGERTIGSFGTVTDDWKQQRSPSFQHRVIDLYLLESLLNRIFPHRFRLLAPFKEPLPSRPNVSHVTLVALPTGHPFHRGTWERAGTPQTHRPFGDRDTTLNVRNPFCKRRDGWVKTRLRILVSFFFFL